jgi:hypothetical protein
VNMLIMIFFVVSILVTLIVAFSFDGETSAIKKFNAFARDNGFIFMPKTPLKQSILLESLALNNTIYAENGRRADRYWRLEGEYDDIPFAIERLETGGTGFAMRDNAPSFVTVLTTPLSQEWPDMAFCSKDLASGITVFKAACIWPSMQWERFFFDGLIDGAYSSYYIDPHKAARLESSDKVMAYLKEMLQDIPCDIEISQGTLYIYISGMVPVTEISYGRFFKIVERSRKMIG